MRKILAIIALVLPMTFLAACDQQGGGGTGGSGTEPGQQSQQSTDQPSGGATQ